ncbi:putative glycerol-3-phosphate transporter 5 [Triticum urartu]|uniref:Major facilitator superfamily (MFS) profile domain-containing protein n=2 Tax=Triticum urartu TaxID=4572 RepID=A0A8R7QZN1_TRIUA|nr:putative glycerol-3-phosphate transporter 5 [Triticum urartu]
MEPAAAPASPAPPHGGHTPTVGGNARAVRRRQYAVLALTFAAYAAFHASRKPPSIVKAVLSADWAPFTGPEGTHRLGELDVAFLAAYAAAMFAAGHLADRADLRLLLGAAMLASGAASAALGAAYFLGVHGLPFFLAAQVASGVVQSAGWPCVVAVVGNWFGHASRRGTIMGVWNSHTSVGNIAGSVLAAAVLEFGWGWSFLVPAFVIAALGVLVLVFLVAHPSDAGLDLDSMMEVEMNGDGGEEVELLVEDKKEAEVHDDDELELEMEMRSQLPTAIGFLEAWRLPGVAEYAFCLFFSKLVAYTFLYWLPFYIRNNAVAGQFLSHKASGILSIVFDIGGVLGGISAGFLSDAIGARAITSALFLLLSIPALILYRTFGSISMCHNIGLMFLSGYFVNGPYSLITTAVATDLGTQDAIKGNSRALATVSAIIDGTGSVGAALGPLLTGYISTRGWNSVFFMLIVSISLALVFLIRIARDEIAAKIGARR